MDLETWLNARGGVVRRTVARDAGFGRQALRAFALGRLWVATEQADPHRRAAAAHNARLACVSAASRRGLALLDPPERLHLATRPNAPIRHDDETRFHTSTPIACSTDPLMESVPDMLEHVAVCLPAREAFVVWESALRTGAIGRHELDRLPWRRAASSRLRGCVGTQSDSLLESLLAGELREAGVPFAQQVRLFGRPVDFLVDGRLVVQPDGYEFHSDARQRREDIEHDARLGLEGFRVLRRDFVQVVHRMPDTVALILRTLALLGARG